MLFANKIMIENGCGIIQIPVNQQKDFFTKSIDFYEMNDERELKNWIYENAMDGINFVN